VSNGYFALKAIEYNTRETAAGMDRVDLEDGGFIREWQRRHIEGILPSRYKLRDFAPLKQMGYR